jgi:hypothetical protein
MYLSFFKTCVYCCGNNYCNFEIVITEARALNLTNTFSNSAIKTNHLNNFHLLFIILFSFLNLF